MLKFQGSSATLVKNSSAAYLEHLHPLQQRFLKACLYLCTLRITKQAQEPIFGEKCILRLA